MKQTYFMLLFSCFLTQVSAQHKPEFGLVIKAGNYITVAEKSKYEYGSPGSNQSTEKYNPGISYTFGVYDNLSLGKGFSLSAELLYRFAYYSYIFTYQARFSDPYTLYNSNTNESFQIGESSISIPIKLHYNFQNHKRTSIALGVGISRILGAESVEVSETDYFLRPDFNFYRSSSTTNWSNFQDFTSVMSWTAGLYRRFGAHTTVGLEFSFEKNRKIRDRRFDELDFIVSRAFFELPNLGSFSVSLRHNLLK